MLMGNNVLTVLSFRAGGSVSAPCVMVVGCDTLCVL